MAGCAFLLSSQQDITAFVVRTVAATIESPHRRRFTHHTKYNQSRWSSRRDVVLGCKLFSISFVAVMSWMWMRGTLCFRVLLLLLFRLRFLRCGVLAPRQELAALDRAYLHAYRALGDKQHSIIHVEKMPFEQPHTLNGVLCDIDDGSCHIRRRYVDDMRLRDRAITPHVWMGGYVCVCWGHTHILQGRIFRNSY